MKRLAVALALLGPLVTATVQAQAPPKPGPEHQRLSYFEGKWTTEGEQKANPFGPAGKFTSNDSCEWILDGFFLKCSSEGKDPVGAFTGLMLLGYDAANKVYTSYGADSRGMGVGGEGAVSGTAWTYTSSVKMKDKTIRSRYLMQEGSPTAYTFKWELADEKGNWTVLAEGKATKAK